jgi:hypothetical protein
MPTYSVQLAEIGQIYTRIDETLFVEALKLVICNIQEKEDSVVNCHNCISFPTYDGSDVSHIQQNDPILGIYSCVISLMVGNQARKNVHQKTS